MATIIGNTTVEALLKKEIVCECGCRFTLKTEDIKAYEYCGSAFWLLFCDKAKFVFECPSCKQELFVHTS
ncbi:MAG: hypothetical protein Q7S52_01280 [bacterium]|nr:hypothetical protein [bacterium]